MIARLVHYEKKTRVFPEGVDVWLPEGAIVASVDVGPRSGAWTVRYLEPTGRTTS